MQPGDWQSRPDHGSQQGHGRPQGPPPTMAIPSHQGPGGPGQGGPPPGGPVPGPGPNGPGGPGPNGPGGPGYGPEPGYGPAGPGGPGPMHGRPAPHGGYGGPGGGYGGPGASGGPGTYALVALALCPVLIILGLSIPENDTVLWATTTAWSIFAAAASFVQLAPVLGRSNNRPPEQLWTVGAVATAALVGWWVVIVLPGVSSNTGFLLTLGTAAAVIGCWLSPGRRV